MNTTDDAFSRFHPAVCFAFFALALATAMIFTDVARIAASSIAATAYLIVLNRRRALRVILGMLPLFLLIAAINPLFNTNGGHVLFTVFSRPYTLEALLHGMRTAGMFASVTLWFICYGRVMTSDRFTALFGNLIPSLSLLLVMIFRLVPDYIRKAGQIAGSRRCIGFGAGTRREKLHSGFAVLTALTSWALENSLMTADSMRARGYGCTSRTHFALMCFGIRDAVVCTAVAVLAALSLLPHGIIFYSILVFTPVLYILTEEIKWRFSIFKI